MRRAALALSAAIALAACTHEDAAPWTPAADPPAVSDSTLSVLFTSGGSLVWERLDPTSGAARRYLAARGGDPWASNVTWSPDGRLAVLDVSTSADTLATYEIDLVSGATRQAPARVDGAVFSTYFFRDGALLAWTDTPPAAYRLDARGWRRVPAAPPDERLLSRLSDSFPNCDDATDEPYPPSPAAPQVSTSHHRGRFELVLSENEPHAWLADDRGRRLWTAPPGACAMWWPGPIAAPAPAPRTWRRTTKYEFPDIQIDAR